MGKIRILVVPSDTIGGVGFYRSVQPHIKLDQMFSDEFEVTIDANPNLQNLPWYDQFDIVHIHKGLFTNQPAFNILLDYLHHKNIVTVMDIDDNWDLGMHHPMSGGGKYDKDKDEHKKIILWNLQHFDYVTTTTEIFAEKIAKFNKNVKVIPNAIDPTDERFITHKKPSNFLRVGVVWGSAHEYDMALLSNIANRLPKDVVEKIQFVLCGYDLRGNMKVYDEKGKVEDRPIKPTESVWYRYEKMFTDDYRIVSENYKKFLHLFIPNAVYPGVENEHYKRYWTKDMNHYFSHYDDVDVLLAPIEANEFNRVKSPLKVAECCFSNTAIIASDYGPYTLDLKSIIQKGGIIDPTGNALLVDEGKNHKLWAKYVEKLVKEPELVPLLKKNLYDSVHEKYDLRNVTRDRAEFYKSIVRKKEE